jgi:hypothetical protein
MRIPVVRFPEGVRRWWAGSKGTTSHFTLDLAAVATEQLAGLGGSAGAGNEVIMIIAAHVSRAMLARYSHVRMEAKRRALDGRSID